MSSSQPGSASTSRSNSIDETASNNYHNNYTILNRSSNSSGSSNNNSNRNSEGGGSDLPLDDGEEGVIQERFAISNEQDAAIALQAAVKKWKAVKRYKKWRKLLSHLLDNCYWNREDYYNIGRSSS